MIEQRVVRRLALIGPLAGERRTVHTTGFPIDATQLLPLPDVVLLIVDREPGATMLFRYTAHGEFSGDTLHTSLEEALEQASFEYEDALGEWIEVPNDIVDAHVFAITYAHERLNDRGGGW